MPALVFKLNQVPQDEADDVRQLLADNQIVYYETSQGNWGFSLGGLWLADDQLDQLPRAEQLIGEYQAQRQAQAREGYQPRSIFAAILEKPLRLLFIVVALIILYFSITPFVQPLLG